MTASRWLTGATLLSLLSFATDAAADVVILAPSADTTIYSESGGLSNALGQGVFAGQTNDGFFRRALLRFDVAGSIPAGSSITAVQLRLHVTQTNTGDLPVGVHRVTGLWGEGTSLASGNGGTGGPATPGDATWSHRIYNTNLWSASGGDYTIAASATTLVGAANTTYNWSSPSLLADVQTWFAAPAQNNGWIVIAQTTATGQAKRFASRENPTAALQPALEITFTPPAPSGACCMPDGSCNTVLDPGSACGGVYQGANTDCGSVACPQPTGACCIADAGGTCLDVPAADCATSMGTFQGVDVPCAFDLCPVVPTPFLDPLPILPVAEPVSGTPGGAASYEVAFEQFEQVVHSQLPPTTVWGFDDGTNGPIYPGPTFEARTGEEVSVEWRNDLRDDNGQLLTSHYLPVDMCPDGATDEARAVIHLHGGHVPSASDGHPEMTLAPGDSATYAYPNTQQAATLWYHDHSMGMTRLNVAMGLAGFYLLRDDAEDALDLPAGNDEIALFIQDKSFYPDGSIRYPATWSEHAFGDTILVNGRVWPYLEVPRGKMRFRVANGSGSRAYRLSLSNGGSFHQIGSDGGLLAAPESISNVLVMPGERVDLVVDFESYAAGTTIDLMNDAPAPYPGPMGMHDIPQVMRFIVQSAAGHTTPLPASLGTVDLPVEADATMTRDFELQRVADACSGAAWKINGLDWDDVTEMPQLGTTEIWRFINRSGVAHPMHMHLVMFRVLDRQPFTVENGVVTPSGPAVAPSATEAGYKDTVRVDPNEIVRVVARFDDYTGPYAYHCHILEHEDHSMMRHFETWTDCGDGVVGAPEESCDDGNGELGDACPDGPTGTCRPAACGDGFLWSVDGGSEGCDDGNLVDGDGCSSECEIEIPGEGGGGSGMGGSGGAISAGGSDQGGNHGGGDTGGAGGSGSDEDDDGCSCRTVAPRNTGSFVPALMAIGAALALRRRRRTTEPPKA
ncbi:MAG: multicopper oxidase domain-containing protein [Polyangiaceae bacterium]|nr:multicopper oxidase domain-containing protein [Polyangiaceae bacterium]